MIETIDVNLDGFDYQVEVDVTEDYTFDEEDDVGEVTHYDLEVYDVYLVKKKNVYKVINEHILEEINNLNLLELYFEQCK